MIADSYRKAVEAGDQAALAELYDPDVLLDAHVPNWRFQVQGREAVAARTAVLPGPGQFASFEAEATSSGDVVVQFEWRQSEDSGGAVVRELHLLRLDDNGRIAEQLVFCAGVWDPELQTRMAAEAPLVRP